MQLAEDGDKRGDAGSSGNKIAFALIGDSAPYVAEDQLIAGNELAQFIGDAIVVMVRFDGEFEVGPFIEAGEGEWSTFVLPFVLMDGYFGSLTGDECVSLGLFDPVGPYVVCHFPDGQYFNNLFHGTIYED